MKKNKGILIQPNLYEVGGTMMWVCGVAFPIHNSKGQIMGMLGVDMSLNSLSSILKEAKLYESGYLSLIAHTGLIAVTKNSKDEGQLSKDFSSKETSPLFTKAIKDKKPFPINDFEDNKTILKYYKPFTVGEADEVWFLGVNVPAGEVYRSGTKNPYKCCLNFYFYLTCRNSFKLLYNPQSF